MLFCRNVLQSHNTSLDPVFDEVIFDLYMLEFVIKHKIFRELNVTLIITMNHRGIQLKTK